VEPEEVAGSALAVAPPPPVLPARAGSARAGSARVGSACAGSARAGSARAGSAASILSGRSGAAAALSLAAAPSRDPPCPRNALLRRTLGDPTCEGNSLAAPRCSDAKRMQPGAGTAAEAVPDSAACRTGGTFGKNALPTDTLAAVAAVAASSKSCESSNTADWTPLKSSAPPDPPATRNTSGELSGRGGELSEDVLPLISSTGSPTSASSGGTPDNDAIVGSLAAEGYG
jgi:hypothetical protein